MCLYLFLWAACRNFLPNIILSVSNLAGCDNQLEAKEAILCMYPRSQNASGVCLEYLIWRYADFSFVTSAETFHCFQMADIYQISYVPSDIYSTYFIGDMLS
jgi:hypothetical protein